MKEEYIPAILARKLIEKGCPIERVYSDNGNRPLFYELPKEHPDWHKCNAWFLPTIAQVMKCLREEKGIYIMIDRSFAVFDGWHYYVVANNDFDNCTQQHSMDKRTWERAAIDGITYSVDNFLKQES